MKYNLTIDGTNNTVLIDYLASDGTTVTGTDFFKFTHLRDEPLPADKSGWWFDRPYLCDDYNKKFYFADIVLLNASPIGAITHAQVTALLKAAIA